MASKKTTVKSAPAEDPETQAEEPGYCIGHFDKADKACEMCEIQDECRQLTTEIQGEDDKENNEDGEKKE